MLRTLLVVVMIRTLDYVYGIVMNNSRDLAVSGSRPLKNALFLHVQRNQQDVMKVVFQKPTTIQNIQFMQLREKRN
jgi:hypothetical protein